LIKPEQHALAFFVSINVKLVLAILMTEMLGVFSILVSLFELYAKQTAETIPEFLLYNLSNLLIVDAVA
jgi:hypothetical protein